MKKYKYILFYTFIALLTLPLIQYQFNILSEPKLDGAFIKSKKIELTKDSWLSADFQDKYGNFFNDNLGFRSFFVKSYNQINKLLYKKISSKGTIIGKKNTLFQTSYIRAINGEDFVGSALLKKKTEKLQLVQKWLKQKNIDFVLVIAPGKASVLKEYIPEEYLIKNPDTINYDALIPILKKTNINYIDLKQYFLQIKDTTKYPLFPRCGTHWSGYAVSIAADTLFKYIEKITNTNLKDFHSESGEITDKNLRFTDDDIGKALNLIWDIKSDTLYYPNVVFDNSKKYKKLNVLSVGDSFNQSFWGFYPYFPELFDTSSRYWYYNKTVSWPKKFEGKPVYNLDFKSEIENRNLIILLTTEQNLNWFGFNFIEDLYFYENPNTNETDLLIKKYKNKILSDSNWLDQVKQKAAKRGLSLDSMITIDAEWMVKNK